MRAYSLVLFYLCLNLAAFLLVSTDLLPVEGVMEHDADAISAVFSITTFSSIIAGGTLGGLIGIITKQYVFAAGITLLWCVGVLYEPISWLLIGVPKMLVALLPIDLPVGYTLGVLFGGVFGALSTVMMFMFFVELLAGRQVT